MNAKANDVAFEPRANPPFTKGEIAQMIRSKDPISAAVRAKLRKIFEVLDER